MCLYFHSSSLCLRLTHFISLPVYASSSLGLCKDPGLTCQELHCNKEHMCGRYAIHAGGLHKTAHWNHACHAGVTCFPVNLPCPSFQLIFTPLCGNLRSEKSNRTRSQCADVTVPVHAGPGIYLELTQVRGVLAHVFLLRSVPSLGMISRLQGKSSTVLLSRRHITLNMACGITGVFVVGPRLHQWRSAPAFKVHALLWKSLRRAPGCEANFTLWPDCGITSETQNIQLSISLHSERKGWEMLDPFFFLCWNNFEMTCVVQFGSFP